MLRNNDVVRLMWSWLKTIFMQNLKSYTPIYPQLTTEVPSTKSSEDYGWLWNTPDLKEWKDERAPKLLLENWFTLVNKDYEASIAVHRNTIKDDQYGQVKIRVQWMAYAAWKGYDRIFAEVIEAWSSTLCYDGQNFFDTDHAEGASWTQSNYEASGRALTVANAKIVYTNMTNFKDDQWLPAGVKPTHVVVPEALRFAAEEIFNPMGTGDTNVNTAMKWMCKVIVDPFFTDATRWYMVDLSQPVKPFIFQNRQPLEWSEDLTSLFKRKEILYGVDWRFVFGYGDWRLAYSAKA